MASNQKIKVKQKASKDKREKWNDSFKKSLVHYRALKNRQGDYYHAPGT